MFDPTLDTPFQLNDRVKPDADNDGDEVARLGGALDVLAGRKPAPPPVKSADVRPAAEKVTGDARAFQAQRGMKVDGLAVPNGPTAQRVAGELEARRQKSKLSPHVKKIGRNASLPLYGGVGRGEANLPGDVRTVKSALALAGHVPKPAALDPKKAGRFDEETERGIRSFKAAQGLPADGRVELYGRDHDLMNEVTAPKLRALIGEDVRNPIPFREPEPRYVGRTMAFRPTTTRAFPVPPENRPDRDDWQIANGIAHTIAAEMDEVDRYENEGVSGGEGETNNPARQPLDSKPMQDQKVAPVAESRPLDLQEVAEDDADRPPQLEVNETDEDRVLKPEEAEVVLSGVRRSVEENGYFSHPMERRTDEELNSYQVRVGNAFNRAKDDAAREVIYAAFLRSLPDTEAERLALEQRVSVDAWRNEPPFGGAAQADFDHWRTENPDAPLSMWPLYSVNFFVGPDGKVRANRGANTDHDNPRILHNLTQRILYQRRQKDPSLEGQLLFLAENPETAVQIASAIAGSPSANRKSWKDRERRKPDETPETLGETVKPTSRSGGKPETERIADLFKTLAEEPDASFYAETDPETVLTAPMPDPDDRQAQVRRGRAAIDSILHRVSLSQEGAQHMIGVPGAMTRPDIGDVSFYWGKPGSSRNNPDNTEYRGGDGVSHVVAKHGPEDLVHVIDAIAYGEIVQSDTARKIIIERGTVRVSLVKVVGKAGQEPNWLVSGYTKSVHEQDTEQHSRHVARVRFDLQHMPRRFFYGR